jgi:hypothetical protein
MRRSLFYRFGAVRANMQLELNATTTDRIGRDQPAWRRSI